MSFRNSEHAILFAAVFGAAACSTTDTGASGGPDATADTMPDLGPSDTPSEGSALDAGRDTEAPEGDADGGGAGAMDAATSDAADDRSVEIDVTSDASDARALDASDARGSADDADAADSGDGGPLPSEVAYVATYLGGIHGFSIDTTTGALEPVPGSPFDKGAGFYAVAVTSSGHFVYAADYLHGTVNGYRIARSGELRALESSPVVMGGGPVGLAVDPAERFVFVGTSDGPSRIFAYRIDPSSGALAAVDHSPFAITDEPAALAVDPQSHFLFVSSRVTFGIRVFAIDGTSGALTEVTGSPFGKMHAFGGGIAFSQVGRFIYNGGNGVNAFVYDDTSGAMTEIEGSPFGQALSDSTAVNVATDSMGGYVFAVHTAMQTLSAFTMDQGTGKLSRIPQSPFPAAPSPYSVGVEPTDRFLLVGNDDADEVSVFSIEATPGDGLRQVAKSPFTVHGLQPEFAFVRFGDGP